MCRFTPLRDTARAMSQENVEVARTIVDAVNRKDWDAVLSLAAPNFEWDNSRSMGADTRGVFTIDETLQRAKSASELFESFWFEITEVIPSGDHVFVPHTTHLRGRDGIEVLARTYWVFTIRDRRVERLCLYQDRQEGLEAAGLSE
jgi:ketosteroid isomerase-like protein